MILSGSSKFAPVLFYFEPYMHYTEDYSGYIRQWNCII